MKKHKGVLQQTIFIGIILVTVIGGIITMQVKTKGESGMQWHDQVFVKALSTALGKPVEQITQNDLTHIKSVYVGNGGGTVVTIYEDGRVFQQGVVDIKETEKLNDLAYFGNLTSLGTNINADYSSLNSLYFLKTIEFTGEDISTKSIRSLAQIDSLEHIILPISDVDYSPLGKIRSLKTITISRGEGSYKSLKTLPSSGVALDLSKLEYREGLWDVVRTHPNITALGKLSLAGDEELLLLAPLTELTQVEVWGDYSDLSPLSGLIKLQKLRLETNARQEISLKPLSKLTRLEQFSVGGKIISSLDGMENMKQLNYFSGSNNLTEDISALSGCSNLQTAYIYDNLITDLSALSECKKLVCLYLMDNEVTDVSPLQFLPELNELYIYNNPFLSDERLYQVLRSLPKLGWYEGSGWDWIDQNLPHVRLGNKTEQADIEEAILRNMGEE